MAETNGRNLRLDKLCCTICLDILQDPVILKVRMALCVSFNASFSSVREAFVMH